MIRVMPITNPLKPDVVNVFKIWIMNGMPQTAEDAAALFVASHCRTCRRANPTTNPNHAAAGYPNDCAMCHQIVAGWAVANVNHPTSPIALTGVHGGTQCTDCHLAGQPYSTVQQTCDGCHHADVVATQDPDHVAAAFSTTCTSCHGLVAGC